MDKKRLIIYISSILIALLALIGFRTFSIGEKLDINSDLVKELYNQVNPSDDAMVLSRLYSSNGTIPNEYALAIGIKKYINSQNAYVETISKEDIEKNIKDILGSSYEINHQGVFILTDSYCRFDYDDQEEQYNNLSGCGGDWYNKFYRKVIKATKKKDKIEIIEKSIYVNNMWDDDYSHVTIYNNIIDKKQIEYYEDNPEKTREISIDDYLDKSSTYKYIFEKENDHYIFKKLELVK